MTETWKPGDAAPTVAAPKRRPGRPRKPVEAEAPKREPLKEIKPEPKSTYKMKAKPNWEEIDPVAEDSPDKLHINPDLVPEGFSLQWVTTSIYGQDMPQRRATFEKKGWTPVHQEDFDGRFDGMFMPKGAPGEILMEGLVLMARPVEMTRFAQELDKRRARDQVAVKERELRGGDLGTSLDSQHPSALRTNRIGKSYERISIPKD